MTPQIPAEGVMKVNDWGSSKLYRIDCQCTDPDHCAHLEVEADDVGVQVSFWVNMALPHTSGNFFQRTLQKLKLTAMIFAGKEVTYERHVLLSEQQSVNLAHVLRTAASEVVTFRELQKLKVPKI